MESDSTELGGNSKSRLLGGSNFSQKIYFLLLDFFGSNIQYPNLLSTDLNYLDTKKEIGTVVKQFLFLTEQC